MSQRALIPISAVNIFENKGLTLFYQVRECLAVYSNCQNVTNLREVGLEIIEVLEGFLKHEFSEQEGKYLDQLLETLKSSRRQDQMKADEEPSPSMTERLKRLFDIGPANIQPAPQQRKSQKRGVYETLKILSPDGVRLLGIKGDIDLNALKKLYKKAARTLHPDMGGDVKEMQLLNSSYSLFHDAIINYRSATEVSLRSFYAVNLVELRFSIHFVLASIYGDAYAADYSYKHTLAANEMLLKADEKGIGEFLSLFLYSIRAITNPARALGRIGMKRELSEVAKISPRFTELCWKYAAPSDEYSGPSTMQDWYISEDRFLSELGSKLVVSYYAQAVHAFRLGAIDEKRFNALQKKFKSREDLAAVELAKISEFFGTHSFGIEMSDDDYSEPEINPVVVSPLFYYAGRYRHLADDQKWFYLQIFKHHKVDGRVSKYLKLRATEILLGLIYKYDSLDISSLNREIDFFANQSETAQREFQLVREFADHIGSLTPAERNRKTKILIELDDPEMQSFAGAFLTLSLNDILGLDEEATPEENKMAISATDNYVEFSKSSEAGLLQFKKTGEIETAFKESWSSDMDALRKFEKSEVAKFRDRVWVKMKNPSSAKVIESHEPYVVGLLNLGKQMHPKNTGQLQVGYSINKLTAAFAKDKNWDKVKFWIDSFFALPLPYRDRSSKGEQESLKKRLARADQQIAKANSKPKLLPPVKRERKSS